MNIEEHLNKTKELSEKATDGPWGNIVSSNREGYRNLCLRLDNEYYIAKGEVCYDSLFIAHARTMLPRYERALRTLRSRVLDNHASDACSERYSRMGVSDSDLWQMRILKTVESILNGEE